MLIHFQNGTNQITCHAYKKSSPDYSCCITYSATPNLYDHFNLTCSKVGQTPLDYEAWCDKRKHNCPQFQYWATTLELEVCILTFVRSLRESNFAMYPCKNVSVCYTPNGVCCSSCHNKHANYSVLITLQ